MHGSDARGTEENFVPVGQGQPPSATTNFSYDKGRSSTFRHNNIHSDLIPPGVMSVSDYVHNEKSKQLSKLRDWYLEAHNQGEQTDFIELRSNFRNSRNFENVKAVGLENKITFKPMYLLGAVPLLLLLACAFIHI